MPGDDAEPAETDLPEDIQEEIRALAAAELASSGAVNADPVDEAEFDEAPAGDDELDETSSEGTPVEPVSRGPPKAYDLTLRAESLRAFVARLAVLTDEAKLVVSKDGLHALAVDPAHVALVEVRLDEVREGGEYPIDAAFEVGVDVEKLSDLLKKAKKDERVSVRMDLPNASGKDELTVRVGGMTRTMALVDTAGMSDPRVPNLNLPARVEVSGKALHDACKAASEVSDHVALTATRDGLNIHAEGDVDKVDVNLDLGDSVRDVRFAEGDRARSLFPLDYLAKILKALKGEALVLGLGTDYPVRIEWSGTTRGQVLVAPRIESDGY